MSRPGKLIVGSNGFSLVELLVVIVVIGILVAVAMRSMDVAVEDVRQVRTEREMEMLAHAITGDPSLTQAGERSDFGYVGDVGAFPPNLLALKQNPGGYSTWDGPYLQAGYTEDNNGYALDEWGTSYQYSGGTTISSTGSGSTITKKIADATDDYLINRFNGTIYDGAGNTPGTDYADSIDVEVTIPNGSGATQTKVYATSSSGSFTLDSIPVGKHPLRIIFTPEPDTLFRYVSIMPRHKSSKVFRFYEAHFGGESGGGGLSGPDTLINADFDSDDEGFNYSDDEFRGTSEPYYASGSRSNYGGYSGGRLDVDLGGVNDNDITNMSGGWSIDFTLAATADVELSFHYNLTQDREYENDEYSQVLASIDGTLFGSPPNDYIDQINGNGSGGSDISTGWQTFAITVPSLSAGTYTLTIGGFNNKKTTVSEQTEVYIDDVLLIAQY